MAMIVEEKRGKQIIWMLSVAVVAAVGFMLFNSQHITSANPDIYWLPKINAGLNTATALMLMVGLYQIKRGAWKAHRNAMVTAFALSSLFLVSYVVFHMQAPQTYFSGEGILRIVYFTLLISHIFLAIFIVPLVLFTLFRAFNEDFQKHRKIARITWPVWMYVAVTGVIIYFMIAPDYPVQ